MIINTPVIYFIAHRRKKRKTQLNSQLKTTDHNNLRDHSHITSPFTHHITKNMRYETVSPFLKSHFKHPFYIVGDTISARSLSRDWVTCLEGY